MRAQERVTTQLPRVRPGWSVGCLPRSTARGVRKPARQSLPSCSSSAKCSPGFAALSSADSTVSMPCHVSQPTYHCTLSLAIHLLTSPCCVLGPEVLPLPSCGSRNALASARPLALLQLGPFSPRRVPFTKVAAMSTRPSCSRPSGSAISHIYAWLP